MRHTKRLILITLAFALAAAALGSDARAQTGRKRPASRRPSRAAVKRPPAATPPAATRTDSGLIYMVTRQGTGRQPAAGETVVVHYTGTLTNGVKFDSSRDRVGEPFAFKLGAGQVIKGWDEGIARLRVGDHAVLVIPPQLGYGSRGAGGVIPPGATLIFVVELVDVKATPVSGN